VPNRIASWVTALPVALFLTLHRLVDHAVDHAVDRAAVTVAERRDDRGQATAEYALVLLGVAAIALAVVSWATRTNLIGKLLDIVFGGLLRKVT
jgi:Flp pilus assembly pilin Flp